MSLNLRLMKPLPEGFLPESYHEVPLRQTPTELTRACVIDVTLEPLEVYDRYAKWVEGLGAPLTREHLKEVRLAVELGYFWTYL